MRIILAFVLLFVISGVKAEEVDQAEQTAVVSGAVVGSYIGAYTGLAIATPYIPVGTAIYGAGAAVMQLSTYAIIGGAAAGLVVGGAAGYGLYKGYRRYKETH
jgi:hypothetical protein